MCGGGAARRAHHRAQAEMRANTAARNDAEAAFRAAEERNRKLTEELTAMRPAAPRAEEFTPAPYKTKTDADAAGALAMRRKKASAKTNANTLRINRSPSLNTGGGYGSGTNIA